MSFFLFSLLSRCCNQLIRVHWESEMFFLTQEYAVSSCKRCVALLSDPDGGIITVRIWLQVLSVFTQLLVLSFLFACLTVTSLLMSFQVICCFHIHPISQYVHFHCLVSAPHYFIYNPCLKWSPVTEKVVAHWAETKQYSTIQGSGATFY